MRKVSHQRLFLWALWLSFLFTVSQAQANDVSLQIEITSGSVDATKIAVVPFYWSGTGVLPEDVSDIVGADLSRTGRFVALDRLEMLSRPQRVEEVVFDEWQALGMEYMVTGTLASEVINGAPQYRFSYQLIDAFAEKVIEHRQGSAGNLRDIAHHIADKVFEKLTGTPGAFSTRIMYVTVSNPATPKKTYHLQIADADGHRVRTLQSSIEPILSPSWSPDGKSVAYSAFTDGRPRVYVQRLSDGKRRSVAAFPGINGAPDWSPDGRQLAMTLSKDGNPEIYILELATNRWRRLTRHAAIDTEPRWSPDGTRLVFTSDRGGSVQLYEVALADLKVKRLTFDGRYNARGDYSPDGRSLLMVHLSNGEYHVALQDIQTKVIKTLSKTSMDESPTMAPNGIMLIYATTEGNEGILRAVSTDQRVKIRIPSRLGHVREPAWSPFL